MIRSTGGEGAAEFHDDEDAAEHTDEGGGGGDGPMLSEDLKCMYCLCEIQFPPFKEEGLVYVVILSEKSSSSMRPSSSSSEMSEKGLSW